MGTIRVALRRFRPSQRVSTTLEVRQDAKLTGVEYIISKALFSQLPAEEKHLWHSHVHEVRSGQLIAPGLPEPAEHELMETIASTYGKTWHTWDTDQQLQS